MRWEWRRTMVVVVVVAGLASCSSSRGAADSTATTVVGGGPVAGFVEPTVTSVDPQARARAESALDAVRSELPFSDEVMRCVLDRIVGDADLAERVGAGIAADSPEYGAVLKAGTECTQTVVFAPQFVETVRTQYGGQLSDDQAACLTAQYEALTQDELQAILGAAMSPTTESGGVTQTMDRLLAACGLPVRPR